MAVKQLSDKNDDGTSLGQDANDKISFHGATPVAQQTVALLATGSTGATITPTVQAIQAALEDLGIIVTS